MQRLAGDYRSAAASSQQALGLFRDLRLRSSDAAYALNELGLVQQLTGDYPAAAASHQQALEICRDAGDRLGQAETLNCLGELASRTAGQPARPATTTPRRWPSPATSAPPRRKHAPWKASATATSATATPPKPPPPYAMRSRSTSASEAPPPSASRKPCASMGSPQPQHTPPPARNRPVNADDHHAARKRASNLSYRQVQLHKAAICAATAR